MSATKLSGSARRRGPSATSRQTRARVLAELTARALGGDAACARVLLDLQQSHGAAFPPASVQLPGHERT
jgi:hypothetical protein